MGIIEILALFAALTEASKKIAAMLAETLGLFSKMNAEGRTNLTAEEVAKMTRMRDAARQVLVDEISKADVRVQSSGHSSEGGMYG